MVKEAKFATVFIDSSVALVCKPLTFLYDPQLDVSLLMYSLATLQHSKLWTPRGHRLTAY